MSFFDDDCGHFEFLSRTELGVGVLTALCSAVTSVLVGAHARSTAGRVSGVKSFGRAGSGGSVPWSRRSFLLSGRLLYLLRATRGRKEGEGRIREVNLDNYYYDASQTENGAVLTEYTGNEDMEFWYSQQQRDPTVDLNQGYVGSNQCDENGGGENSAMAAYYGSEQDPTMSQCMYAAPEKDGWEGDGPVEDQRRRKF
ncbi:unnamed protein product [Cyprideis torosa]|uniref:Uncharacterized protein n=1 Tax=Cyprideis torosa TaxID=163714 RepID=A0A7R8W3F1_9CRUS|nr:unnamed protein product [Cyprideis torosa]CAG0882927.1 unnamed protein product [Cyprideis torosa]